MVDSLDEKLVHLLEEDTRQNNETLVSANYCRPLSIQIKPRPVGKGLSERHKGFVLLQFRP